jgi:hypothetical protein
MHPHSSKRGREAVLIRDAALEILAATGRFVLIEPAGRILEARLGEMHLLYRTPFQKLDERSADLKVRIALFEQATGKKVPRDLEYGLDIWCGRKVLNVEWSTSGDRIDVVSFRRGAWEQQLLSSVSAFRS